MNKNLLKLMSLLMTLFILQGCALTTDPEGTHTGTTTPLTQPADTTSPETAPATTPATTPGTAPGTTTAGEEPTVNYQILRTVPEGMQSSFEMYKNDRGYYYDAETQVLVIFMGQRSTGGYSIVLREIEAADGVLQVIVQEKSPGPNDIVTQAFTYPALILKLEDSYQDFNIQDTMGKPYDPADGVQY